MAVPLLVPGLFVAVKVAVCAPVVAELFTMMLEVPGSVPLISSGVVPSVPALSVSEIPDPPVFGAGIVTSPVGATLTPYADSDEVPTVERVE
jgi:hypothetical protein